MSGERRTLERRCRELTEALGLGAPASVATVRPLGGGVSSDIAMVELAFMPLCMKFALPKLKVAESWHAPVHRNAAEYAWLSAVAALVPRSVPRLYGRSEALHGFAMEFVDGPDCRLWKRELLDGQVREGVAASVGRLVGQVHAASTRPDFDTAPFHNRDDFHALRLEPYLRFTAARHPDLAARLHALADALYAADAVLVHGDLSPKNILLRAAVPVLLDAECATMGDASFDVAFCLNHLLLKAVHLPDVHDALIASVHSLWSAYTGSVEPHVPGPLASLEARVCALLPALMLARIDGKSPVEYLSEADRSLVRSVSVPLIHTPPATLAELTATVSAGIAGARP